MGGLRSDAGSYDGAGAVPNAEAILAPRAGPAGPRAPRSQSSNASTPDSRHLVLPSTVWRWGLSLRPMAISTAVQSRATARDVLPP